jgi:hypothetical protein
MPSQLLEYRLFNRLDLAPSFTSLGLRPELFRDGGDHDSASFDAALSGPTDTLWLFRGEDVLGYDLRENRITRPPMAFASTWAGGGLPGAFGVGVDSACWAGPRFPELIYLFREAEFIRLDCSDDPDDPFKWKVTIQPTPIRQEWLRAPTVHTNMDFGPAVKLYGLREAADRVHFFTRDGRYARHDLTNGECDIAPTTTTSQFPLPEHFGGRVDVAFYGAGADAEHIFFFCRFDYAEYDIRRHAIVRSGAIEQRFPDLATYIIRPQLFLVEDYAIDTYIGPLTLGRLVSTLSIPAESRMTRVVLTEIVTPATAPLRQNLLESQSPQAVTDFYAMMLEPEEFRAGRRRALIGGDVSAGILNGEVDAAAGAGQLDELRGRLAQEAFATIAVQASRSTHQVRQLVVSAEEAGGMVVNAVTTENFDLNNPSTQTRQVEFMELLQAYATLLVLANVRAAYTNGRDRPRVFALQELGSRLPELLVDPQQAGAVIAFAKGELSRIQDSSGEMRAFLAAGMDLAADTRVKSVFVFDDIVPPQQLELFGIVKSARNWRQTTYQTRPIDIAQEDAALPHMEIARLSIIADPAVQQLDLTEEVLPQQ